MHVEIIKPRWHLMKLTRVPRPIINTHLTRPQLRNRCRIGSRIASGNGFEDPPETQSLLHGGKSTNPSKAPTNAAPTKLEDLSGSGPEYLDENKRLPLENDFLMGNIYLLVVAVLWGSYSPALRGIFTTPGTIYAL